TVARASGRPTPIVDHERCAKLTGSGRATMLARGDGQREHEMSALEREIVAGSRVGAGPRGGWAGGQVEARYALPLNDLLYTAQWVHRQHFDPNTVQVSTLLSIKTGACPEDCAYCPQSIRFATDVDTHPLLSLDEVRAAAQRAKDSGATRFCMGASYRGPKDSQ